MGISNLASGLRTGVCTSTTRPTAPYNGQVIYETDSKQTLVWQGSAWVMLTDADTPPGLELVSATTVGSAVSSVTINSCFTSTYDNYKIMFANIDCTTDGNILYLQLTTSGTASTTGWAGNTFYVSTGNTGGLTNAAWPSSYAEALSVSNASTASGMVDIFQPQLAQYSRVTFHTNVDDVYFRFGGGIHKVSTSYDGVKISISAGTMTGGTIRVYGYRNTI